MVQAQIFDFLGVEDDPIFNKISQLEIGQAVCIRGMTISLNNFGLYEIETDELHESFATKEKVYDFVSN